jgi:hypothetical protein
MIILKSDNDKLTFIIDTMISIELENRGGSFALHKLAYEIALKGHYVYIFNNPKYPHKNIEVIPTKIIDSYGNGWRNTFTWDQFKFNLNRTISILPQTTPGNPFNTIHNVRWVLHDFSQEQWNTFDVNDVIFNYGTFKVPEGTKQLPLTIFDYNFDKFYNKNNPDRNGFGHIIHKNTPQWGLEFLKRLNSSEIPHYNGKKEIDYLLDEFNKYEYILTFDDKTYYTVAAALCGAKSIILNTNDNMSPFEYRSQNPAQMCGVAYGMNDIKWANDTINLVKYNLQQLEIKDKKTVDDFVKYWEKKIKKK